MDLTGSEILLECFLEQGVDTVFGYPGGAVLNIYDALYKYKDRIKHYLTSHEQGAAHAADGYARSSGRVGVCIATSGPGATNLVTGIATAYMDSVPMVAVTGNVALSLLGKDSFQEVDIAGITLPITKHNYIIKDISELASKVRKAFYIAKEGRPGPVLIDIPKDVTAKTHKFDREQTITTRKRAMEADLSGAAALINKSKKPLIYAGGGVIISESSKLLKEFADKIDAPVCLSVMGIGGLPSTDERFTGLIGMHGSKASNFAAMECDLLIAIGARFSDRVVSDISRFASQAKILHFDVDEAEINKNIKTHFAVAGDLRDTLKDVTDLVDKACHSDWMDCVKGNKRKYPLMRIKKDILQAWHIMDKINELTNGDAIYVTEVGQNQMWAAQYLNVTKPRTFISSGGLGTMGYGLGAAIGAGIANPGKTVFNIAGDGCFRMNNIELATAAEYGVPVIVAIIDNRSLGMVRQWQTLFYDSRYSHTDLKMRPVDYVKLAEAYGIKAYNVSTPDEVGPALSEAIALREPVVVNFVVGTDDRVLPMIPMGDAINEFIFD